MKKIIYLLIMIFVILFTTIVYATPNINFWRESRLQPSIHGDGYQYIPSAEQFTQDGCGTGTVLDHKHGLCWDANGNRFGTSTWAQAHNDCEGLTLAGRDWRLPTIHELLTIVKSDGSDSGTHLNNLGVGFINYQNSWYWTGDIYASNPDGAWEVSLSPGGVVIGALSYNNGVVCVSRYRGQ